MNEPTKARRFHPFLTALAFTCTILTGCGGGSNDSGGSNPPPPQAYAYRGVASLAPANTTTAEPYAIGVVQSANNVISLVADINYPPPPGKYDKIVAGPAGGTVHLSGTIAKSNTGTLKEEYNNYQQNENGILLTENGLVTITYNEVGTDGSLDVTVAFGNFETSGGGQDLVLTGSIRKTDSGNGSDVPSNRKADLLLTDQTADSQIWMHPLIITDDAAPDDPLNVAQTISGRFYLSNTGYMDVSTSKNLLYYVGSGEAESTYPHTGGPLQLRGIGTDAQILLKPMNSYYASLGLDRDNDGRIESGNLYDWTTLAFRVDKGLSSRPVADAKDYLIVPAGAPVILDGRMSRGNGNGFLAYHWNLIYAPPGSQAKLGNPNEAITELTPDLPGSYLAKLTVTDANGHTAQSYVHFIYPSENTKVTASIGAADAGPDETAQPGTLIQLDGSLSIPYLTQTIRSYSWELLAPPGSQATLSNTTTSTSSFTPDVPGIYQVTMSTSGAGGAGGSVTKLISAGDNPVHFDSVKFHADQDAFYGDSAMGDLNGDRIPDLVFANSDGAKLFYGNGNGRFAAPVALTSFAAFEVTIGDLNNDSRGDLVLSNSVVSGGVVHNTVLVFLQQIDGSLGKGALWVNSNPSQDFGYSGPSKITNLFGQAWDSLWMPEDYQPHYHVFDLDGDGEPGPQAEFPFSDSYHTNNTDYVLADINGDGVKDLAFEATPSGSINNKLVVALGAANRNFLAPVAYSAAYGSIGSADLNGDGRQDIILLQTNPNSPRLSVRYGQSNGKLSDPANYPVEPETAESGGPWLADLPGLNKKTLLFTLWPGLNQYLSWYTINADGSLGNQRLYPLDPYYFPYLPNSLQYNGDLNDDGLTDLVMADEFAGNIYLFFGTPWPAKAAPEPVVNEVSYSQAGTRQRTTASLLAATGNVFGNLAPYSDTY